MQLKNQKKLSPQKTWKLDLCKVDSIDSKETQEQQEEQREQDVQKQSPEVKILEELQNEEKNDQDSQVEGNQFLEHAKRLKNTLDKIEKQINTVEVDLTKKLKNIKYYIGYISSIEDFLPTAQN